MTNITDKKRLDWLSKNMSKIGANGDSKYSEVKEYTNIRKRIKK